HEGSEWTEPGSNRRPKDFQSFALPAELSVQNIYQSRGTIRPRQRILSSERGRKRSSFLDQLDLLRVLHLDFRLVPEQRQVPGHPVRFAFEVVPRRGTPRFVERFHRLLLQDHREIVLRTAVRRRVQEQ